MRTAVTALVILLATSGCGTVAADGSLLNHQVSVGIDRYQEEVEKLIHTLADIEREELSERWDEIHGYAVEEIRAEYGLSPGAALTDEQMLESATLASMVRESIQAEIAMKEQTLILQARTNALLLTEVNDIVTAYLQSQETLDEARSKIEQRIGSLTGIDSQAIIGTVSGLVEKLP